MGKRKEDQRRDDSSSISSNTKRRRCRCRHYQNRETNDGTPPRDVFHDAVIELRDAIQVKLSTEEEFKSRYQKLNKTRRKDKNKHKEELRKLKEKIRILTESFRILKEGHEDLKSKIQEMRNSKEGCAEVDQHKAYPSQRSQISQSTRFRLVIENSVITPIYKNETIETEDGGGCIRVIMYDGGNSIAPDHPLASAKVDLVVIEGRFNEPKRDSWSKEEFEKSIITPREGMIRLVKNGTFDLIDGSCNHPGAIIMDNSQKKEVKLGVMIAVHTEERVIEGVSNPFKVQEGKTKSSKMKGTKPSPPVPTRNFVQPTSTHAAHGQALVSPVCRHDLPPRISQDVLQGLKFPDGKQTEFPINDTAEDYPLSYAPATLPLLIEGNGQALNGNGQNCSQRIRAQILGQSSRTCSIQHAQDYSWPPPNDLQSAVNQHLRAHGQDQDTNFPYGNSELAHPNPLAYTWLNDIQPTSIPEDVRYSNAHTQMQPTYETYRCGRVLLQWDNVELMPLYSTKSRFYGERFPNTGLMHKAHKLLGSISSVGSIWKMITSVTSQATQTRQRRGVLVRPIEPYDSDDGTPFKKQRNARYQLRFVNRVCNDYYTREKIKSEDGTFLKVALYDQNNLVVTSGPLSSASVEVVLLQGDFNAEDQDYWTPEEFSVFRLDGESIHLSKVPVLAGDLVLALTNGEADLGNINFLICSFVARTGKFKMGVEIKNGRGESVQEGITSSFVVRDRVPNETFAQYLKILKEDLAKNLMEYRCQEPISMDGLEISISALSGQSAPSKARKGEVVVQKDDRYEEHTDLHTTRILKRIESAP